MLNACRSALLPGLVLIAATAGAELSPGVVVDGLRGEVFVMGAERRLESLDLQSGAPSWSTTASARPLAAHAGRVLAQLTGDPGRLQLAILERGNVLREASLPLPAGAEARIDDLPGSLFRIEVEQAGPALRLRWTSERRELQGIAPEEGPRRFEGRVAVDLAQASIVAVSGEPASAFQEALPPNVARDAEAGTFRERPRKMGAFLVATQRMASAPTGLVLRRFDAQGLALPIVSLADGLALQLASDDARHVLLSRRVEGAPHDESHQWTVLDLQTGATVAELRAPLAAAPFSVVRGRVLYVQPARSRLEAGKLLSSPLRLRSAEAASGITLWSRPVHDTAYRGPRIP